MDIMGLFACKACAKLYPSQLEADLCTPAYKIPELYPGTSV